MYGSIVFTVANDCKFNVYNKIGKLCTPGPTKTLALTTLTHCVDLFPKNSNKVLYLKIKNLLHYYIHTA